MSYDLIEAVLRRPKMYTINGTYPEIVAFLEGYYSGLALPAAPQSVVENYTDFWDWLDKKLEISNSSPTFHVVYQQYGEQSLEIFKKQYEQFKAEKFKS